MSVCRRFSHFVRLHNALAALLPGIALPPLPEKAYAGRFNADFVEARRGELDRYIRKIVAHPVLRYTDALTFFLGCEDELEFQRELPRRLRCIPPFAQSGPGRTRSFFTDVHHPDFHFDVEDAEEASARFAQHSRAVAQGVQRLRSNFGRVREARIGMASGERLLSYTLLSLITAAPLTSSAAPDQHDSSLDSESDGDSLQSSLFPNGKSSVSRVNGRSKSDRLGLVNNEGAWCWRDDCSDCLRLTKCMQKTAETLQGVADLFDDHANRVMYATEDKLKDAAHPDQIYAPILDIHDGTLNAYKSASSNDSFSGDGPKEAVHNAGEAARHITPETGVSSRCETVLNTTMAELDVYHTQKLEDFESLTKGYLDDEIAFYEKILSRLRTTRATFDVSPEELTLTMPGPRQPSIYESLAREISTDIDKLIAPRSLARPCPHVLDRPGTIGSALQGGVDIFVAGVGGIAGSRTTANDVEGNGAGRSGAFSRLW